MTDVAAPAAAPRRLAAQQKLWAFASLIALLAFFSLASPNFLQTTNILAVLQATAVNGVLAIAVTMIIITGGIDLSIGTLMTFCAVTAGVCERSFATGHCRHRTIFSSNGYPRII